MRIGEAQEDLVELSLGEEIGQELHSVCTQAGDVLKGLSFGVLRS